MKPCPECGGAVPPSPGGPGRKRTFCTTECRIKNKSKAYSISRQRRLNEDNDYNLRTRDQVRRTYLDREYSLSVEGYDTLLTEQGGVCAICGNACSTGRRLAVDHCHITKTVRGLLCMKCNRALGLFGDDPPRIQAAINYLTKSP